MTSRIDQEYLNDIHIEIKKIYEEYLKESREYKSKKTTKADFLKEIKLKLNTVILHVASELAKKYARLDKNTIERDLVLFLDAYIFGLNDFPKYKRIR